MEHVPSNTEQTGGAIICAVYAVLGRTGDAVTGDSNIACSTLLADTGIAVADLALRAISASLATATDWVWAIARPALDTDRVVSHAVTTINRTGHTSMD